MKLHLLAIPVILCAIGCHNWQTRTYSVTVKNEGAEPVTVWLTKDGEPYEPTWFSPEDLVLSSPKRPTKEISGVVIPPGKTADTGQRTGRFAERTNAILRVYEGKLGIDQLLAIHEGARRKDLVLEPGSNSFVVRTPGGALEVHPGN